MAPLPEKLVRVPKRADTSASVNVVVDSLTLKVTVVAEPDVNDAGFALMEIVGAAVSYEMLSVLEAVLLLPMVSVNLAPTTEIEPVPDCVLVDGVNTAEYAVEDVAVSVPMLPPETVTSSAANVDDASDNVNVMVSVWPDRSAVEPARVMVTVGNEVS